VPLSRIFFNIQRVAVDIAKLPELFRKLHWSRRTVTQGTAPALRIATDCAAIRGGGHMVKLVLLAGLLVLIAILAAMPRRVPSMVGVRGESADSIGTPQHAYLRLHSDDELVAKP
jgi:hypothetical protein